MKTKILIAVVVILLGAATLYYSNSSSGSQYAPSPVDTTPVASDNTVTPPVTDSKTPTSVPSTPVATTYTLADVAVHKDAASCWSSINGIVYDLTAWIDKHPGGASKILSICGKDGSPAFSRQHLGEPKPEEMLKNYDIGTLVD